MLNSDHQLSEERYNTLFIQNSQENNQIESYLQAQKFHQRLKLQISLIGQPKITLISKCLSELRHLSGLHIIFNKNSLKNDNSLEGFFNSLRSFHNLTDLTINIQHQLEQLNYSEISSQFQDLFIYLLQLEKISITIPSYCHINQEGEEHLKNGFQSLKCLKELNIKVIIENKNSLNNINQILTDINQSQSLISLLIEIENISFIEEKCVNINWLFDNMVNLKQLTITTRSCQFELDTLNEQLRYLQTLRKLRIQIESVDEKGVNQLINTLLNLKSLEELNFSLKTEDQNLCLSIGEEVCSDSLLKTLNLNFIKQYLKNKIGTIAFGKQIQNIKQLEKLEINTQHYSILKDSYKMLSVWKYQWTKLEKLIIETHDGQNEWQRAEFMRDCFFFTQSIKRLSIDIDFNTILKGTHFLSGLSRLSNLESLICLNLAEKDNLNSENQYKSCFEGLKNLKQLSFDYLKNENEISYLGQSLQYLTNLVSLKVSQEGLRFKYFDLFFQNLKFLQSLEEFRFDCWESYQNEKKQAKIEDFIHHLKGLLALKNLKKLTIHLVEIYEFSDVCAEELINILKELKVLAVLNIYLVDQNLKNRIKRKSLRLVHFKN